MAKKKNVDHVKALMNLLKGNGFRLKACGDGSTCKCYGTTCRYCSVDRSEEGGDKKRKALYNELAELIGEPTLPKTHKITFEDGCTMTISDEEYKAKREKIE